MFERPDKHVQSLPIARETLDEIFALKPDHDRPLIDDFHDLYPDDDERSRDKKMLQVVMENIEKEKEELDDIERERYEFSVLCGECLERVILEHAEMSNWLGPNALVSRTTKFDDVMNGVDAVAEFPDEHEQTRCLALAIDSTSIESPKSLKAKVARNLRKVLKLGNQGEVKYFQSQVDDKKQRLQNIVPVVIGMDHQHVASLLKLFATTLRLQAKLTRSWQEDQILKTSRELLVRHPAQLLFLEEIEEQLIGYESKLREQGVGNVDVNELAALRSIIQKVLVEKRNQLDIAQYNVDGVFDGIHRALEGALQEFPSNAHVPERPPSQ